MTKVLAVLLDDGSPADLRRALGNRRERPTVRIVAPADVSFLDWYASAEDEAHAEAEKRAHEAELELAGAAEVEAGAGELDPVLAVEDALQEFPAEEIVVVGGENGALESSLRRFGRPVTRLAGASDATTADRLYETRRALMSGRSRATPLVAIVLVNLALLVLVVLLLVMAAVVSWLA